MSDEEFIELTWDEIMALGDWAELSDDDALALWVKYYLMDFTDEELGDFWEYFDEEYMAA